MPTYREKAAQELKDRQEQLKVMSDERNEYWEQVKRVLALASTGSSNDGEKEHKGSEML
jgi:flagellar biosynthesis chaperone FliJ